ncbi:MAG: hypothetical protein WCL39_03110 [Armatimonadota bacterium]
MTESKCSMSELVSLSPRFLRSVHLERDFYASDGADGYLVTRGSISVLSQLARGTSDPSYRAQCISGPYGSGKSAVALYFAKLLDQTQSNGLRVKASHDLGDVGGLLIPSQNKGYITILATGTRESISASLMRNLKRSLEQSGRQQLLRQLMQKHRSNIESKSPSTKAVVEVFEDLARIAASRHEASGVVVVVDELGKLLEHAALRPEDSDIQILQEMAEAASRSHENPLWFVTILHQQFSHYASRLGSRHQRDWARVQQRFYDVPCLLDGLDAFQLVAKALNAAANSDIRSNDAVLREIRKFSDHAPRGVEHDFEELCLSCYPLHPSSLILLPALFKRFGQNERSLFSYLSAQEPYSLRDWVRNSDFDAANPAFVRLPEIYDYASHTLIGGAPAPQVARAWAEVEDAITRLGDAPPAEVAALKSIGLLGLVGEASHLPASPEIISLALSSYDSSLDWIDTALKSLQDKKLVVFRRYRNAFRLWEGSDVDIAEQLATAYQALPTRSVVLAVARDLCPVAPIVARRHSFRTGMLRSLAVYPMVTEDLLRLHRLGDDADGWVIQCLVENDEQRDAAVAHAGRVSDPSVVVLIGKENEELVEAARDVAALEWVRNNTPALAGDRVARQELSERMLEAEMAFRSEWNRIFAPYSSEATCFWGGDEKSIHSTRGFASLLSDACDVTFKFAPILQNELINRRRLSSAAAAARGNLVKAMLSAEDQPSLGITGYPPERSIYESLLKKSDIHRQDAGGRWSFGEPNKDDPGLLKAWELILVRTHSDNLKPTPVKKLFKELSSSPYGVADGFVPVLLLACLVANRGTMALYEDGVFIPELSPAVVERLMRRSENFAVLGFGIDGERAAVIERFARGYSVDIGLLPVARSLYQRMGSLTRYAEITKDLPSEAIAVREAIIRAKSPERLMFLDLPTALGCSPFQAGIIGSTDNGNVEVFFERLNSAFDALARSFEKLLQRVRQGISEIFDIEASDSKWRGQVDQRATKLYELAIDPPMRALAVRARESQLGDNEYIESLGASIVGQPPSRWSKADEESFARLVPQIASQVRALESAQYLDSALEEGEDGYLLSISGRNGQATRQIVRFSKGDHEQIEQLVSKFIGDAKTDGNRRVLLAALAEAARRLAGDRGKD